MEGKIRQPAQQGCDRDLGLYSGQLGAEAEMPPPKDSGRMLPCVMSRRSGSGYCGIPVRSAEQTKGRS
jgi:hypothetical protein